MKRFYEGSLNVSVRRFARAIYWSHVASVIEGVTRDGVHLFQAYLPDDLALIDNWEKMDRTGRLLGNFTALVENYEDAVVTSDRFERMRVIISNDVLDVASRYRGRLLSITAHLTEPPSTAWLAKFANELKYSKNNTSYGLFFPYGSETDAQVHEYLGMHNRNRASYLKVALPGLGAAAEQALDNILPDWTSRTAQLQGRT